MPNSVFIIAEAGVNHNGSLSRALEMIDVAADAKANAIKFQTFLPSALASERASKADYQLKNEGSKGSQLEMLERLALDFDDHYHLMEHCSNRGIEFLSSPFDSRSADFLINDLNLPRLKLGSGELTNGPLLWKIGGSGRKLILSTGMADLPEITEALGLLCRAYSGVEHPGLPPYNEHYSAASLKPLVSILHCTTEYPCPPSHVNLRAMDTLAKEFGLESGYSDHTNGIEISLAAVARGARIIEKHFTLDQSLPGPDHAASMNPQELRALVSEIRNIEQALGSPLKTISSIERSNADVVRKSLVASRPIKCGEIFSADNITGKRPANGISPMDYWSQLGKTATRDYQIDDPLET